MFVAGTWIAAGKEPFVAIRRDSQRGWLVDLVFHHADGRHERIRKISPVDTKIGAQEYERQIRESLLRGKKEVPTVNEFWPRYEEEHLAFKKGRTQDSSKGIHEQWLRGRIGSLPLDRVAQAVPTLRATLR